MLYDNYTTDDDYVYPSDDYYTVADYLDNNEGKVYCLNLRVAVSIMI